MPGKWNNINQKPQDNQKEHTGALRKTILRNPEVPIAKSTNFLVNDFQRQQESSLRQQQPARRGPNEPQPSTSSKLYHVPSLNKAKELRQQLEDVKKYQALKLEILEDAKCSPTTKYIMNREITAKLNYPPRQKIYKDLPKLYGDDDKNPDECRKADNLIRRTARNLTENASKRRSLEIREEINSLMNELVELEYKEAEEHKPKHLPLPSEDDFLGFSKFSSPYFHLPNKRTEVQRYVDTIHDEIYNENFKSETYLEARKWDQQLEAHRHEAHKPENRCKCLSEFYDQHSTCQ